MRRVVTCGHRDHRTPAPVTAPEQRLRIRAPVSGPAGPLRTSGSRPRPACHRRRGHPEHRRATCLRVIRSSSTPPPESRTFWGRRLPATQGHRRRRRPSAHLTEAKLRDLVSRRSMRSQPPSSARINSLSYGSTAACRRHYPHGCSVARAVGVWLVTSCEIASRGRAPGRTRTGRRRWRRGLAGGRPRCPAGRAGAGAR